VDCASRRGDTRLRPGEERIMEDLQAGLARCVRESFPLPGIEEPEHRHVYVRQAIDSIRRVRYPSILRMRPVSSERANGQSALFDPLKAAIVYQRAGSFDEACWLIFIFVHFGKHSRSGYRYAREVYGALGTREPWTFVNVAADSDAFRSWLEAHRERIARGNKRGFGNHRKYLSLSGYGATGTGSAFASYVEWVMEHGNHSNLIKTALAESS
jgi:hypothetical protein